MDKVKDTVGEIESPLDQNVDPVCQTHLIGHRSETATDPFSGASRGWIANCGPRCLAFS